MAKLAIISGETVRTIVSRQRAFDAAKKLNQVRYIDF